MTIDDLIADLRSRNADALEKRAGHTTSLADLRAREVKGEDVTDTDVEAHRAAKVALDAEIDARRARIDELEGEKRADAAADKLAGEYHRMDVRRPAYDQVARIGAEKRQYNPDSDRRGLGFLRDVGLRFTGDFAAAERLSRHMAEEFVERGAQLTERSVGTGQFTGLTVPQYLTDLYAPNAKANRPFADACNKHAMPESGMTVNLSLITTGSSAALQATQNTGVSETNMADTLLSIPVKTNAGQQTISRQGIERGTGIEDTVLDDLFRAYATTLDSTLINEASTGLTNVAVSTATYVDATPTVAELYPKFLQALSLVEAALLDQDPGDNIAIMHSRRWYWLQNAIGSTWPFAQQPGILPQMGILNLADRYGGGVRGVLPNGTAVIVDNNVPTLKGAGTEDEIYVVSQRECHLWEDANAPLLIRAEQPAAANLGVLFVVYGYFAYTHARYPTAPQKISGTGLIAPSFTGV